MKDWQGEITGGQDAKMTGKMEKCSVRWKKKW